MGKINYTLLNASVLNASRLNMTGEPGNPGGGAGGYWPAGTPAAIRRSAVLWYDIAKQGATNETMAANPVLKDLSGHGHDATCYNFGWEGMSGVGGYAADFTAGDPMYVTVIERTYKIIRCTTTGTNCWPWFYKPNKFSVKPFSAKISGLNGQLLSYFYSDGTIRKQINITSDGVYDFPESIFADSSEYQCGFYIKANGQSLNVTIEQLPLYPGALVSDGVDDYAVVDKAKQLTNERGFTVIAKRKILSEQITSYYSALITDTSTSTDGAFLFEGIWSNSTDLNLSFGAMSPNAIFPELESFLTSKKYNSYSIPKGDTKFGNDTYTVFAVRFTDGLFGAFPLALYSLLLFDRDLTDEEIEWVKNNLIENNYTVDELDASLVDAWIFSGYRNEDAPASVSGEKGHALTLRNFAFTEGSGFSDGCLVTDGVDDYGICADFPIKDTYTLIMKFATLNGKLLSAVCSTTYFDDSGTRRNGIYPIYIAPNVPYASFMGRRKNVAASSELAAVWMNKEAFCGEAYDDTSGQYTPPEGQECTFYVGRLDDRGIYGGYKLAYLAFYDKVMTAEEAEAEVEKLEELWTQRSGGA